MIKLLYFRLKAEDLFTYLANPDSYIYPEQSFHVPRKILEIIFPNILKNINLIYFTHNTNKYISLYAVNYFSLGDF